RAAGALAGAAVTVHQRHGRRVALVGHRAARAAAAERRRSAAHRATTQNSLPSGSRSTTRPGRSRFTEAPSAVSRATNLGVVGSHCPAVERGGPEARELRRPESESNTISRSSATSEVLRQKVARPRALLGSHIGVPARRRVHDLLAAAQQPEQVVGARAWVE